MLVSIYKDMPLSGHLDFLVIRDMVTTNEMIVLTVGFVRLKFCQKTKGLLTIFNSVLKKTYFLYDCKNYEYETLTFETK